MPRRRRGHTRMEYRRGGGPRRVRDSPDHRITPQEVTRGVRMWDGDPKIAATARRTFHGRKRSTR